VRLVTAFHNVAAHKLAEGHGVDCDVLVFSDDTEARAAVVELIATMGLRGLAAGSLANSAAAEALTSLLIFFNKTYKADGAGVRFTGLTTAPPIA
jgi:predicted dinucleotide-binding enzyme